ncbi:MAG: hypothetical protein IT355_00085 [Gemmatimonadaceae bacterium]|nr:hypothetical protein [Gemmatimonadaceae bacterium]
MNGARRGVIAALLGCVTVAACTEVSTDPQVPVSLQFDSLPALAVVVGDTMRDGTLQPARLPVRAFSGNGSTVSDSQLRVLGIDTTSVKAFGLVNGLFLTGKVVTAAVRIVAQAGGLQSQTQTFAVVAAPTALTRSAASASDSIVSLPLDSVSRFVDTRVRVLRDTTPVNGLRVHFRVAAFPAALLDSVRLVGTDGRNATSALMTGGAALIRVKVYPKTGATGTDSVLLEASINALGASVPGSPLTFPIRLTVF